MKILLIGPVGSGKSTQALILSKDFNLSLFQSGEITRRLSQEDSRLGRKVRAIMEKGELIDDQTIAQAIKREMDKADLSRGYVFDGFPRSLEQQQLFDPKFDVVFNFKIPNEITIDRLLKRKRGDDTPEAIQTRLDIYNKQTMPLIEHYLEAGILREVDATLDIESVSSEIKAQLPQYR